MVRSRRESLHSDGITDQKSLQRPSATKSANKRHSQQATFIGIFDRAIVNHVASGLTGADA
jgi:hypothetical protein